MNLISEAKALLMERNNLTEEEAHRRFIMILLKISEWQGKPNLNVLFNYNMPIRGYAKMTGGFVTMEMAEALTEMANGHRIRGTAHLIKAAVKRD